MATETELKLAVPPPHLPALTRLLETRAGGPGREARLVAAYFDTPDGAMARQGLTLRVRAHPGGFIQTVKSVGSGNGNGGAALVRGEWEDEVAGALPDPHAPQTGRFIPAEAADRLAPLVRTDIVRRTLMLCPDPATRIEAAVDQGEVAAARGNTAEPICEIELELKSGEVAALYDIALDLLAVAPVRLERRGKGARGFRLASLSNEPQPSVSDSIRAVHASEVALDPEMSAGAALRRLARSCTEQIVGNEAAVLAGMPEGIHQMRVGVRRLRAILSAFAPLLEEDEADFLSDELRWLGNLLGDARNLDALAEGLVAPARQAIGKIPGIEALNAALAKRRAAACADAAEAIGSPRYTALVLRLLRWSEERDAGEPPSGALAQPFAAVAPRLLQRRFKQVRRRGAGFAKQSPEKRHRLRIALKKLRYATEALGQLYNGGQPGRLLRRARRLQQELGEANDLRMSHDLVAELARGEPEAAAIAASGEAVLDWHAQRLERRDGKIKKQVRKIRDYSPFW